MLVFAGTAQAQPDSLWSRTFGGDNYDVCSSLIQTADGGFALAGYTNSFGVRGYDFWLVLADENGDSLWSRTFGGMGAFDYHDICYSMIQMADGGFALAGFTQPLGAGHEDFWLLKVAENGDSLWSRIFDWSGYDRVYSLIQTDAGEFALAGWSHDYDNNWYNFRLVLTDENGDSLWTRSHGGRGDDGCTSLIQTVDGGFALAGWKRLADYDFYLVRVDENGDSLWSHTYGGDGDDVCGCIIQLEDEGFLLAGKSNSFSAGDFDFWLVRTDENGDSLWSRTFGGELTDICYSAIQTADGGYALAGYTNSFGAGGYDMWLVKTNADGDSLWSLSFGGELLDECYSVIQVDDGGYALAGFTASFGAGENDFWLVKTGPDPVSVPSETFIPHPLSFILHPSFPNPFNSTTNIRFGLPKNELVLVRIIDLTGNVVETLIDGRLPAGYHTVSWNSLDYPTGVYICNMQAAGFSEAVKMVLVK